jgi:ATP-dependent Lon protease
VDPEFFDKSDFHLHVPAGSQPKDGPSAGVTMATALVSLISGRAVHRDVGMTGEITLRGQVLPVGGIKEKVLAAHRSGLKTVILPNYNAADLEDIPQEVRDEIHFVFVDTVDDVLKAALDSPADAEPADAAPVAAIPASSASTASAAGDATISGGTANQ